MTEPTSELRAPPLGGPQQILDAFRDVVDLLLPLLKPYEAAIYVHLFRHSWADTGQPLVRLSYRTLRTEVVKPLAAAPGAAAGALFGHHPQVVARDPRRDTPGGSR